MDLPDIRTFMSDKKLTDVTALFSGYTKIRIWETYGTFWLLEENNPVKIQLQKDQEYSLDKVIAIGYYMQEGRKSLPTFNYSLSFH